MTEIPPDFVKWKEVFVCQEGGNRVVHNYLEDAFRASHLEVVGTERSLRHMIYMASDEFRRMCWLEKLGASGLKWRSRRKVCRLACFSSSAKKQCSECSRTLVKPYFCAGMEVTGHCDNGCHHFNRRIHSFGLVMSEKENCYFAYLEDMYDDRKGQNKGVHPSL